VCALAVIAHSLGYCPVLAIPVAIADGVAALAVRADVMCAVCATVIIMIVITIVITIRVFIITIVSH